MSNITSNSSLAPEVLAHAKAKEVTLALDNHWNDSDACLAATVAVTTIAFEAISTTTFTEAGDVEHGGASGPPGSLTPCPSPPGTPEPPHHELSPTHDDRDTFVSAVAGPVPSILTDMHAFEMHSIACTDADGLPYLPDTLDVEPTTNGIEIRSTGYDFLSRAVTPPLRSRPPVTTSRLFMWSPGAAAIMATPMPLYVPPSARPAASVAVDASQSPESPPPWPVSPPPPDFIAAVDDALHAAITSSTAQTAELILSTWRRPVTDRMLTALYKRLGRGGNGGAALAVHRAAPSALRNVYTYSALIDALFKSRRFDDARAAFAEMAGAGVAPNAYTYNIVAHGALVEGKPADATAALTAMLASGVTAGEVTRTIAARAAQMAGRAVGRWVGGGGGRMAMAQGPTSRSDRARW